MTRVLLREGLVLSGALVAVCASVAEPIPELGRLAIYYGFPSSVNGATSNAQAIAAFDDFDVIILGAGLELPSHPDHADTVAIIAGLPATAEVYGYIDIGVTNWRTLPDIQSSVTLWDAMGVDGIFFDEFGYDFQVTRSRQNTVTGYAHAAGLAAMANGYIPDDCLGSEVNPTLNTFGEAFNPAGTPTALSSAFGDGYLLENLTVANGQWHSPSFWMWRAGRARHFADTLGVRIHAVSTSDTPVQAFIDHGHRACLMWEFDSYQHTYGNFSATGPGAGQLDLHPWPSGFGTSWTGPRHERTNRLERETDLGLIEVHGTSGDPGSFGSSFTPGGVANEDAAYPITVGGGTADWAALTPVFIDPDESPSTPGGPDFGPVWMTNDATSLHLRFLSSDVWALDLNTRVWLDTDRDRTTGYRLDFLGADHLVEGSTLYAFAGASQSDFDFSPVTALSVAPVSGISDFEMAIPRAALGLSAPGASLSLRLTNSASVPNDVAPDFGEGAMHTQVLTDNLVPAGISFLGAD